MIAFIFLKDPIKSTSHSATKSYNFSQILYRKRGHVATNWDSHFVTPMFKFIDLYVLLVHTLSLKYNISKCGVPMKAEIRQTLLSLAEPEYPRFSAKLMPTVDKETVLGIRAPLR